MDMTVKIIPQSDEYREGYDSIKWDSQPRFAIYDPHEPQEIVYGSDTEGGRRTMRVKC